MDNVDISHTRGSSKSVASFSTVEFRGDISLSLLFFVVFALTFFFLANKGSLSKDLFLLFFSFFLPNLHSNNEALIASGSSPVGPFHQQNAVNQYMYL